MKDRSRREALKTILAGGVGLSATVLSGADISLAQNQPTSVAPVARAFRGQHQPKPLPFNPAKLSGISEKLMTSHWENNYGGAVKALNAVEQRLSAMLNEKDLPAFVYGNLKREEMLRTGSVVLHETYFANLGGNGKAGGEVLTVLKEWFGSYQQWEAEFKKTAMALSGGSGWVVLSYNLHTAEVHNNWSWDHLHHAPLGFPLLVLDMYEHAYQMDYGAAAAKYLEAFLQNVNWEVVNHRFERAQKITELERS